MNLPKKYNLGLTLIVLLCCQSAIFGQLTGSKHIPGDYATITAAVTALNASGVGAGGVTFNIAAGYTETISATISITATGTAANPIIFQKDGATSGNNPLITAYATGVGTPASALQDGIWRLVGSDYVTINSIDITDNPSNTTNPSTMEYGYALYKASTSNGCQFDTIKNCVITLNRVNNATGTAPMVDGSTGIIVMNALYTTATTVMTPIAGGTNSNNSFYGNTIQNCNTGIALIGYAAPSPFTLADTNNDVGGNSSTTGNTIINYGGAASAANAAAGIRTLAQYSINISYNTINNNNGSGVNHPNIVRGIYNNTALSANATITNNTITINGGGTTQIITAIENAAGSTAASNTINISNNTITNCTYTTATSGGLYGIYNTATPATLTINGNIISGNATSATTGLYYAIFNSGAVPTAININSNSIGTSLTNAITFNAANSGAQLFINNTAGTATAALSISNNDFQGINYATAGTGTNTYISNSAATLSQAINNNTFTNLNVNTTGNITFIANSVIVSATGTQNVNNNSISGTFTKATGGTVTLFSSAASSVSGSVINNNNNNFSNITVTGATIIAGWTNTDAGASTKNIQNNTFNNWTAATGTVTGISVNLTGTNNATSGNTISNISSTGSITGIATAAGNDNIYSNTINTLSSTGTAAAVIGISITAGTTKNIYRNKIYDLQSNNATGTVNGISVSGTTSAVVTANIYNNTIGNLRTPISSAADPIRGISITSTRASSSINIYYNTIYLNASSTGTNFGTTGIYHSASATATTATLDLRNNIIINTSVANGTGLIVAYRRSSTALGNYSTTSNNNLFYSGVPATNKLIFYDGTNADQTLAAFKTRVSTREAQSVTEDMITGSKFLSTSGASSSFLHLDPTKATLAESGGAAITGFADDYDAQTRQGSVGYAGTGTAPDIGADEFDGIQATALAGTYNVGTGQTYTSLTNAGGLFAAINSLGLGNNVTINITSDLTEDGSNSLYQWVEQGVGNYSLTINPDATTTRIISGDVVSGLIRFNGADRVTIDGSSGKYLTFRNTNTAGTTGTVFTFINGASNNTIQRCTIEAYAGATNGAILFSTSTVTGGNSNNLISYCNINATVNSNTGNLCIYSAGTVGNENSANTISNNNIYNYRDRAIDISSTGSTAWTISGNSIYNGDVAGLINYAAASTLHGIRILGGAGYSILNNYIGGNAALATGSNANYSSTLGNVAYQGVVLTTSSATPASSIKGNTIAGINITSVPTVASSNSFIGIETNGSGINIGGSSAGDGNIIGSNTTNSSIIITTTTGTATFTSIIRGINCLSTGGLVIGNQVGGIDIKNIGTAPAPSTFLGIYVNNATAPTQVNNNIIGSTGIGAATNSIQVLSSSTSTKTFLTGIAIGAAVTSTVQIDGNIVQNLSHLTSVTTVSAGGLVGISSAAIGAAAITITNNTISSNSINIFTTGLFYGIYNSGTAATISINNNTIIGSSTAATTGIYYAIYNGGTVTSAININNNNIGNSSIDAITFSAANSGAQVFIYNAAGAAAATLSISNNNFQGITYSITSTGTNTYISNAIATLSQAINNNTFTNLNPNTSGNITFISNNVVVSATGTQNVNYNAIVGTFSKAAGGTVTFFTSAATSVAGSVINNNNNNFSNITVTGATVIAGWTNTDAGASTKNIQNNTFNAWTGGTGAITALSVNLTGTNNATSGNIISNISGAGAITGIATAAGNDNIYSNTINSLSSTGAVAVTAISVTAGTLKNIYRNKIYDLQVNNAAGTVNGILVSGSSVVTVNIYNNIIGDLRTPATNSVTDAIRGISVISTTANSTINVYYNTIFLNASSTGTNFSSTGVYHTASATATTASLNLRNNIITNISTAKGTGLTVAYRISSTALNNYATTSNTNLFYAGTPSASKLIFYNGTNSDQTLTTFKARVSTRETHSVTEDLNSRFISTTGSSASYLHINNTIETLIESGGENISGFTDDQDGEIRQGNVSYAGTGTAPDIGADEIDGIKSNDKVWVSIGSTDWNTAINWLSGYVPDAGSDIILPGSLSAYPVLSAGTFSINDITLQTGSSLTVNGATLQIAGAISNNGTFNATNAVIEMNGTTSQTIPSGAFLSSTIKDLTINNNAGVTLGGTLNISGVLKATSGTLNTGGFLTLLSTASQTALIDGSGAGTISGNVTMQRYLSVGFGYKYLSSPFQAATVNELADDIDLTASFPNLYKYDENLASSGYVNYTNSSGLLTPLQGYVANFGSSLTPKTISISGVVNNGIVSSQALYNHNKEFTQGFNLVGNPYPSPIDWNVGSGWTRTNIDNAVYYFNASNTDQYTGTYSSYINGVSSDGVADNVIASMQGFFVHVSNGTFPVTAGISINNNARVNNLSAFFHRSNAALPRSLLRLEASFADAPSDPMVVYFNDMATTAFDKEYDALKLMNSNSQIPNLYSIASDTSKLSVAALPYYEDSTTRIPLGLTLKKEGWITFKARDIENMPDSLHIYLADAETGNTYDLRLTTPYRLYIKAGKIENRFELVFSTKELVNNTVDEKLFTTYSSDRKVYVNTKTDKANIIISNTMGQVIYRQSITGKGLHEFKSPNGNGIYIISLVSGKIIQSQKIFIRN